MEAAAPEFFESGYYDPVFSPEKKRLSVDAKNADHFAVDDLLDLPNDDDTFVAPDACLDAPLTENSADSSPLAAPHHPSSFSGDPHFSPAAHFSSGELCVPYEESAELEWLSKFVEDSFSSEDLQKLHLIQGAIANPPNDAVSSTNHYHPQTQSTATATATTTLRPQLSVPAKARSKRSRAAPGNWTSRLLAVSSPASPAMSSSSDSEKKPGKPAAQRKREGGHDGGGEGRKCLHCATDKTPQWRTGPMGPKTLCNACGVRYKSGRLVPEYRPAASPTFTLTKHSNSHRKVLELRRQKEMQKAQPQPTAPQPYLHHHHHLHQNVVFDVPNGEDYLIHQHIGPDYRQLI